MNIVKLQKKKQNSEKIICTTCYDSSMAELISRSPIDLVLVGDSVGNVMLGHATTTQVTMKDMIHHSQAVSKKLREKLLITDLPFLSYHNPTQALDNAAQLIQKGGAHGVKLEGAADHILEALKLLKDSGVAVMGHLGFTPQSLHDLGGYRVQGRGVKAAEKLKKQAKDVEQAGAFALVLEMVPQELARVITEASLIPVIGIGAGKYVDGQILVLQDLVGMSSTSPSFVKTYGEVGKNIIDALQKYSDEVQEGTFPGEEHSFS